MFAAAAQASSITAGSTSRRASATTASRSLGFLFLDTDSHTSIVLCRLILKYVYKCEPSFIDSPEIRRRILRRESRLAVVERAAESLGETIFLSSARAGRL